jgi:DNA-binding NarL/FixJ family response regulator
MIRVLLVDDDPLVRSGLRLMLGGAPDIEVEALRGRSAASGSPPSPGSASDSGSGSGSAAGPAPQGPPEVLVLTTFNTDEHVLRALRAGAAGFLLKDTPPGEIVAAVRKVVAGEPVLSPTVARQLIARVAQGTEGAAGRAPRAERARAQLALLGDREREVALAVGEGRTNAEIAAALYLSVPTVKTHVSRILAKLGLNNRVQIALVVHDADPPGRVGADGSAP